MPTPTRRNRCRGPRATRSRSESAIAVKDEENESAVISFFELQIKTLFQHAWSESEHDLGYKPTTTLSSDQKRRLAFTAAQAWGADQIFDELFKQTAGSA